MTTSRTEVILKFTKNFNKILKAGTSQPEAWAMIEKDVRNTLMDHHLKWVADAVAIFAQELPVATTILVKLPRALLTLAVGTLGHDQ
eukprot:2392200-Rhodomonas_salina.1